MPMDVTMPALGESVTEGTITRWLKSVGDQVDEGEALLEVSTDKVDTEIPSPATGTLTAIVVGQDETAAVGATLATLAPADTAAESTPDTPVAAAPVAAAPATVKSTATTSTTPEAPVAAYASPLVRKLAADSGVDLSTVTGTGVGGRIRQQDVVGASASSASKAETVPSPEPPASAPTTPPAPTPSPLRGRTQKLSRTRAVIARRMVESLQVSAQLTTVVEVDVTRIAQLRTMAKTNFAATHGVKLTFLPFFALAAVEALRVHPTLNAQLDLEAGTVTYHDAEHLAVAVDTDRGLIVPVIRDAGDLSLAGLARRIADVAQRTRAMKLAPDETSGGTFTITNTGSRGALIDTPILNQPQVAIWERGLSSERPPSSPIPASARSLFRAP